MTLEPYLPENCSRIIIYYHRGPISLNTAQFVNLTFGHFKPHLNHHHLRGTDSSKTRAVWPDLANFRHFGTILRGYIVFGNIFYPPLAKMLCYRASFHCCRWPNISKSFSHLVTLDERLIYLDLLPFREKQFSASLSTYLMSAFLSRHGSCARHKTKVKGVIEKGWYNVKHAVNVMLTKMICSYIIHCSKYLMLC